MDIKSNPAKTMLTIAVGFIIIYLATKWSWALYVSLGVGLTGVFSHFVSEKIEFLWFKLAWLLGLIVPNIILGIIFYLFLFPISLVSKIFRKKDVLHLKNVQSSIFEPVTKNFNASTLDNPW